jgi:uncharacterized protein GlcG (DUF336 family)
MRNLVLKLLLVCAAVGFAAGADAQPMPYGPTITLDQARKAAAAAQAEAAKNNWPLAIAVVTPSGDLAYFLRMDNTQFGSNQIAQHKARAAARFRRATKVFADGVAKGGGGVALLSLDDVIASEGGIPIAVNGQIIGAIGCSGATGQQDGVACQAGVDALK